MPNRKSIYRIRRGRLDAGGRVTMRYLSRLRHFHVSYKHRGQPAMLLLDVLDDGESPSCSPG